MRRIVSLVLMLLLVLRGLVGTAMAAGMVPALPQSLPAQPGFAVQHHMQRAAPVPDSSGSAATVYGDAHPQTADGHTPGAHGQGAHTPCASAAISACDGTTAHAHSPLCSACEICHSALLLPAQSTTLLHAGAVQVRSGTSVRFASAAAALAIKPPIA